MTYPEAIQYLDSFVNYEKQDSYDYKRLFKLERMSNFARMLGDPHKGIQSIHIGGTKGKGSTASMVYSMLKRANFKTGLYTSPHLVSFRERIRINGCLISEYDMARLLGDIKDATVHLRGDAIPTLFEIYTAMAFLYFKENKVDFAVYEVGLGGRLDATNIINPYVSVITPISYEHTDKLGNTLSEIAAEKGGIIKEGRICVSAPQEPEALEVIKNICAARRAKLIHVGSDIVYSELGSDDKRALFNISGMSGEYRGLESRLLGPHQMVNAATAIAAVEALGSYGIKIGEVAVREGIADARWSGRLDVVQRVPFIVLDGAQNRASANALAESVTKIFPHNKLILVLGVSKDKDIPGILKELLPITDSAILTKSRVTERAAEPMRIKKYLDSMIASDGLTIEDVSVTQNIADALLMARSKALADDMILVTGSLFVIGEAMDILGRDPVGD